MRNIKTKRGVLIGSAGVVVAILIGFLVAVPGGPLRTIDILVYQTLYPPSSTIGLMVMLFFTALGSSKMVIVFSVAAIVVLGLRRRSADIVTWVLALSITEILTEVFKQLFSVARPVLHVIAANGNSYPSGHASAAGVIAALTAIIFSSSFTRKSSHTLLGLGCFAFVILVALSRLTLGVHWFSDVLGGAFLGSGTALLCSALVSFLKKRNF